MARSFLTPAIGSAPGDWSLVNDRSGLTVATRLELAVDSTSRRRGLLGRSGLGDGDALILAPCGGVHTWFMRFAIDVVFVGRDGRVARVVPALRPWRLALSLRAHAAVELAAGRAARTDTRAGDVLRLARQ